jgi:hypothetical protein
VRSRDGSPAGRLLPEALDLARRGGPIVLFGQQTAFPRVVRILESGILPGARLCLSEESFSTAPPGQCSRWPGDLIYFGALPAAFAPIVLSKNAIMLERAKTEWLLNTPCPAPSKIM